MFYRSLLVFGMLLAGYLPTSITQASSCQPVTETFNLPTVPHNEALKIDFWLYGERDASEAIVFRFGGYEYRMNTTVYRYESEHIEAYFSPLFSQSNDHAALLKLRRGHKRELERLLPVGSAADSTLVIESTSCGHVQTPQFGREYNIDKIKQYKPVNPQWVRFGSIDFHSIGSADSLKYEIAENLRSFSCEINDLDVGYDPMDYNYIIVDTHCPVQFGEIEAVVQYVSKTNPEVMTTPPGGLLAVRSTGGASREIGYFFIVLKPAGT